MAKAVGGEVKAEARAVVAWPRPWGRGRGRGGVAKVVGRSQGGGGLQRPRPRPWGHGQGRGSVAKSVGAGPRAWV